MSPPFFAPSKKICEIVWRIKTGLYIWGMENTHTTTTGVIAQAIAKYPQAQSVVLVDQVRAMTAEQMVQTAAAYSYAFYGADVINNCRESYIRQGYGTIDEFYHRLMELRDGKI